MSLARPHYMGHEWQDRALPSSCDRERVNDYVYQGFSSFISSNDHIIIYKIAYV